MDCTAPRILATRVMLHVVYLSHSCMTVTKNSGLEQPTGGRTFLYHVFLSFILAQQLRYKSWILFRISNRQRNREHRCGCRDVGTSLLVREVFSFREKKIWINKYLQFYIKPPLTCTDFTSRQHLLLLNGSWVQAFSGFQPALHWRPGPTSYAKKAVRRCRAC